MPERLITLGFVYCNINIELKKRTNLQVKKQFETFHLTLYICTIVSVEVIPSDSTTE